MRRTAGVDGDIVRDGSILGPHDRNQPVEKWITRLAHQTAFLIVLDVKTGRLEPALRIKFSLVIGGEIGQIERIRTLAELVRFRSLTNNSVNLDPGYRMTRLKWMRGSMGDVPS